MAAQSIPWVTIVTSAGIGAIISPLIGVIDRHLERRSRRDELALTKAIEAAWERTRFAFDVARETNQRAAFADAVIMSEDYYRWLTYLLKHGRLPQEKAIDEARRKMAAFRNGETFERRPD